MSARFGVKVASDGQRSFRREEINPCDSKDSPLAAYVDGVSYDREVVIDRDEVRKRKKKASKKFREAFGHTPLSLEERIPWKCRLVVGTGAGALPVMKEVKAEDQRRKI